MSNKFKCKLCKKEFNEMKWRHILIHHHLTITEYNFKIKTRANQPSKNTKNNQ